MLQYHSLNKLSLSKRFGGTLPVGSDKTRGAQQGAAEIAHYNHHDIRQPGGIDLPQNRPAGRASGFTIVVEPKTPTLRA
jgi:hypothetical protein